MPSFLARTADCTVCFTVTTVDEGLWRKLEPGTAPPWQRLRVLQQLVEARVKAVVRAAAQHGARFLGTCAH